MTPDDGPLVDADEAFTHQIAETHAYVFDADRSWTEKVCAMAAARDGSLQVGFGIGKYTNRNVFDGYAAVSRGREQWTVRASRRLSDEPDTLSVGPLSYEVVEPYRRVVFACAATDAAPVAFEWAFEAAGPAHLENRDRSRSRRGYRLDSDLLRYHQVGVASGWVEVEGVRVDIEPPTWFSTRDHSWGVRHDVGLAPSDIEPSGGLVAGVAFRFSWSPMLLERPDGSRYAVHHQHRHLRAFGYEEQRTEGSIEEPDGRVQRITTLHSELTFDPANRRVLGGTIVLTMEDGSERPIKVRALGDTGVHLGLGLYMGLDGHHHGEWRGPLHVEGEHVPDCTDPEAARRIHQIRDAIVAVEDPVGGGTGWANLQTTVTGAWPELGLDEASSFV
ncbi:MAG: hypothetical protein ACRDYE_10935 [Acidimicrobiales bacterium]